MRSPTWAAGWPIQSRPSVLIRRPSAHLAKYKTATPRAPEQTLGHFHSVSLSLRLTALSSLYLALSSQPSRTEPDESEWWSEAGIHGTAAGPLAGVRAPQRVSAPPSSGLAAVTPLPSPASSSTGSAIFLLPRRRKVFATPGEVLSFPVLPRLLLSSYRRTGIGVRVWEWGFHCFLFACSSEWD